MLAQWLSLDPSGACKDYSWQAGLGQLIEATSKVTASHWWYKVSRTQYNSNCRMEKRPRSARSWCGWTGVRIHPRNNNLFCSAHQWQCTWQMNDHSSTRTASSHRLVLTPLFNHLVVGLTTFQRFQQKCLLVNIITIIGYYPRRLKGRNKAHLSSFFFFFLLSFQDRVTVPA